MTEIPKDSHTFEIRLHPDGGAIGDFDAWLEREKKRLETAGLTVTEINGTCFSGYYGPDQVDLSIFDNQKS